MSWVGFYQSILQALAVKGRDFVNRAEPQDSYEAAAGPASDSHRLVWNGDGVPFASLR